MRSDACHVDRFDNEREAWEFEKSELEARLAHYEKGASLRDCLCYVCTICARLNMTVA